MRFGKTWKIAALIMIAAGVVWAAAAPYPTLDDGGFHALGLVSTSNVSDTGVGFYYLDYKDSSATGFYLQGYIVDNTNKDLVVDTYLAMRANGTPKMLSGSTSVSGSSASTSLYITTSDTAKITVALSGSSASGADSRDMTGSWSNSLTNSTGTARDSVLYSSVFSSKTLAFVDSSLYTLSGQIGTGESVASSVVLDTRIAIRFGNSSTDSVAASDTARIIVFGPSNALVVDTYLARVYPYAGATYDSVYVTQGTIRFDSGTSKVWVVYWSDSTALYKLRYARVIVGTAPTSISSGGGTVSAATMDSVVGASLTISPSTPTVASAQITDLGNDTTAKVDAYARYDSNTSGFDTRVAGTVFEMNLYDATGDQITKLASGQDFQVVVGYNFGNMSASTASGIKLLRLNPQTEQWEVVKDGNGSTAYNYSDSTNKRVVARVSEFSIFALGNVTTSSTAPAVDDDDCVINATVGRTGFANVIPALRNVRDSIMNSVFGRFIVSSYYGFGLAMMLIAGAGFAVARRRN